MQQVFGWWRLLSDSEPTTNLCPRVLKCFQKETLQLRTKCLVLKHLPPPVTKSDQMAHWLIWSHLLPVWCKREAGCSFWGPGNEDWGNYQRKSLRFSLQIYGEAHKSYPVMWVTGKVTWLQSHWAYIWASPVMPRMVHLWNWVFPLTSQHASVVLAGMISNWQQAAKSGICHDVVNIYANVTFWEILGENPTYIIQVHTI